MKWFSFYTLKTVLFLTFTAFVIVVMSLAGLHCSISDSADEVLNTEAVRRATIVIDPGHGGEDGGAEAYGIREKDINFSVSKMLTAYLGMSAYETSMTRTDDRLLYNTGEENNKKKYDLLNRIKFAESIENSIFVSIHQNKFEIPKYKGLQVYYSANNPNSKLLAEIIQKNSRIYLDSENKREAKKADFRIKVLNTLEVPAVLVECGFLSNKEEALLLSNTDYQEKLAFMIYISILEFLDITENENEE